MEINSSMVNYERGRIVQAAEAVLEIHRQQLMGREISFEVETMFDEEFRRLLNNRIQLRNEWGDLVQLAMPVVLMAEGYVPDLSKV